METSSIVTLIFCVIYFLEAVFILLGNIFTIFVFWKRRAELKRTSYLLVNLAFADLLVALSIFIYCSSQVKNLANNELSTLWEVFCLFTLDVFCETSSLLGLLVISVERLYAVRWPFRHRTLSTRSYIYSIMFVWVMAGILSFLFFAILFLSELQHKNISVLVATPLFLVFLAVMCVANILIYLQMRQNIPEGLDERRAQQNKKLTKTLLVATAISLICWLPGVLLGFVMNLNPEDAITIKTLNGYRSVKILNYANSFVNPVVYAYRMPLFKYEIKGCFSKCFRANETKIENQNLEIKTVSEQDIQGECSLHYFETKL